MYLLKVFLLVFLSARVGSFASFAQDTNTPPPGHAAWDELVRQNVYRNGTVNYNGFAQQRDKLDRYIQSLENTPPQESWSREARLAYWINLYNAATVRLVLDHFPIKSIMAIRNPWGQNILTVGGEPHNLNNIEHDILRPMGDPRIHFAINCASTSCPVLQPFAFTAAEIDRQLDEAAREFINDPTRNRISDRQAELSRIFKWYEKDFVDASNTLIDYLNQYLDKPIPPNTDVGYLSYDWSLNRP